MFDSSSNRRHFLLTAVKTVTGVSAAVLPLTGCAGGAVMQAVPHDGRISVPLRSYPALRTQGGALQILADQVAFPIYLVNTDGSTWRAYSAVCSHMGCIVAYAGRVFQCPCHGSAYDIDGAVIRGPAPAALSQLPVEMEAEMVHIIIA